MTARASVPAGGPPRVSVFTICRNAIRSIRRCVESVATQDFPDLEYIIQDGASTDGTIDVLRDVAARFPGRVTLISEPDGGPADAFFKALRRCRGAVIGSCMSDEELMPGAVSWAAEQMANAPEVGAIYGDIHLTDIDGHVVGTHRSNSFDVGSYLRRDVNPPFAATFFRRRSLEDIGLGDRDWDLTVGEAELFIRLGCRWPVRHIPGFVAAKYAVHPGQLSADRDIHEAFARANVALLDRLFDEPGTLAGHAKDKAQAYAGLHVFIAEIFLNLGLVTDAKRWRRGARRALRGHEPVPTLKARLEALEGRLGPPLSPALRLEQRWLSARRLETAGDFAGAYSAYRWFARTVHPRRWLAAYRAGSLARRLGQRQAARRAFLAVVGDAGVPPENRAGAAFHLGEMDLEAHRSAAASEWFERALKWNAGHEAAARRLAECRAATSERIGPAA